MNKWFYLLSGTILSIIVISVTYFYFIYKADVENNYKYLEVSQDFGEIHIENDKVIVVYQVTNITEEEMNLTFG